MKLLNHAQIKKIALKNNKIPKKILQIRLHDDGKNLVEFASQHINFSETKRVLFFGQILQWFFFAKSESKTWPPTTSKFYGSIIFRVS